MRARCHDTLHADRCEREMGHDGAHRNGSHVWATRNMPVPPWLKELRARDETNRGVA